MVCPKNKRTLTYLGSSWKLKYIMFYFLSLHFCWSLKCTTVVFVCYRYWDWYIMSDHIVKGVFFESSFILDTDLQVMNSITWLICYLRNKIFVPVFYRGNKLSVLVLVRVIKSRVLTRTYLSNVLHKFFWTAYVDRMSFAWLFLGIPIKFHSRSL